MISEKTGKDSGVSAGVRTNNPLKPEVPARQGAMWSGIQRVPHSRGWSKPVNQQPGNKWQSELQSELRENLSVIEKKIQSGNNRVSNAEEQGKGRSGGELVGPKGRNNKGDFSEEESFKEL